LWRNDEAQDIAEYVMLAVILMTVTGTVAGSAATRTMCSRQ